jgi:ATP-dependent Lhr-like helicase
MDVCGPTTATELARYLLLSESEVFSALLGLEQQGQVLRGTFWPKPGVAPTSEHKEFCDRRLLQRIHRLTVGRLRKEIEPLNSGELMRFLFRWHHIVPTALSPLGDAGVHEAIALLEGYEAPGSQWESALLRCRVKDYEAEMLDHACFSGEVAWGRLSPRDAAPKPQPARRGSAVTARVELAPPPTQEPSEPPEPARVVLTRHASLSFMRRSELEWMLDLARPPVDNTDAQLSLDIEASEHARAVAAVLSQRGASFFLEIVRATGLAPERVESALWELLARGAVSADAVDNLRVLQSPKRRKRQRQLQRGGPGRWWLLRPTHRRPRAELLEQVAMLLLRRYGIVWRDLVAREPLAPHWRELAVVYRRLEARGEIRGGRFIGGLVGEQFALPDAVEKARAVRRAARAEGEAPERVELSAADPLNLTGILPGTIRVPAVASKRIVYVDGVPEQAVDAAEDDESGEASPETGAEQGAAQV